MVVESLLCDRLRQQQDQNLNDWFQRIANAHSEETAAFLGKQSDRFANPIAHAFREATESIYQALVESCDVDREALEYAIKIKAVQGHDPSEAVAFIHLLKGLLREMPSGGISENEWMRLESRIDQIASIASEMFVANRCKIAQLAGRPVRVGIESKIEAGSP
jgi:hypothetical protein